MSGGGLVTLTLGTYGQIFSHCGSYLVTSSQGRKCRNVIYRCDIDWMFTHGINIDWYMIIGELGDGGTLDWYGLVYILDFRRGKF